MENSTELDNITVYQTKKNFEEEIKLIEKIISLKKVEILNLSINKIEDSAISKIIGYNTSLKKLKIKLILKQDIYKFDGLLNKFKNLKKLEIELPEINSSKEKLEIPLLQINENLNSEINKFKIEINGSYNCFFYCGPYERLTEVIIKVKVIKNFKTNFPVFNENNNVLFNYLSSFEFQSDNIISQNLLNNLYNNINSMPYLKYFNLDCISKVKKDFYQKFLIKIFSLLYLKNIYFSIRNNIDTEEQFY